MNSTFYLVLLVITLFGASSSSSFSISPDSDKCVTTQCKEKRGMEAIDRSLNPPTTPCTNFYKFSCGAWIAQAEKPLFEVLWNHWRQASHRINAKIKKILQEKSWDSGALRKASFMYEACLDTKTNYTDELLLLCDAMGGWPMGEDAKTSLPEYNWPLRVAQITRTLQIYPLFKLHVDVDYRNPSQHLIYIDSGDLVMPNYILEQPENHLEDLMRYKEWIVNTAKLLYPRKTLPLLKQDVNDVITLELRLAKLVAGSSGKQTMELHELNKKTNRNWLQVFRLIFDGSGVEIGLNDSIATSIGFLNHLITLLTATDPRIIANYVMWHLVKELSRDASASLRYENFRINSAILGIEEDYPTGYECTSKVAEYFQFALMRKYTELFIPPKTFNEVKRMGAEIKSEFLFTLKTNKWFSRAVIDKAIEKIASVKIFIGFPKWLADKKKVESFYRNIRITGNHFLNVIHLKERLARRNLQKLSLSGRNNSSRWPSNLFEVNGYYNSLQNSIIIPLGLLGKPFFDIERSAASNYGALGSLIGHELAHGLDEFGKLFAKSPAAASWWTDADAKNYHNRLACFREHYDDYDVNGQQTIVENVADNVGLESSFRAYRRNKGVDRAIPFSGTISREHSFFVSYAQMWCEVLGSRDEFLNNEEHAPVQFRVQGAVTNNVRYRQLFGCQSDSRKAACKLW